ncbi:hypothetical protein [Clostridium sp. ZS2-4]|nr:hypothetical protein [Clostridium sp. ZS2-4]MCY6356771.1 hypothetical protein [Clostridium sp. ZS2-4]
MKEKYLDILWEDIIKILNEVVDVDIFLDKKSKFFTNVDFLNL